MDIDWKEIVRGVAPIIGGTIGGPFGGAAVKFLADKWLGNKDATEQEIAEYAASSSPADLAKLRELDNTFKIEMARIGLEEKQLHASDRDSARKMAIAKGMYPQIILSTIYTVGYFILLYQFASGEVVVPIQSKTEFSMVLGVMTAAQVQIMNFWFGSSSGSKEKTVAMTGSKP